MQIPNGSELGIERVQIMLQTPLLLFPLENTGALYSGFYKMKLYNHDKIITLLVIYLSILSSH